MDHLWKTKMPRWPRDAGAIHTDQESLADVLTYSNRMSKSADPQAQRLGNVLKEAGFPYVCRLVCV
jgi:hypothetical protein